MTDVVSAINSLSHYYQNDLPTDPDSHQPHHSQQQVHPSPNDTTDTTTTTHCQQNGGADTPLNNGSHEESQEESPCINVVINNVVSSFGVRCHINLRKVASQACNVEYKIANGMVSMKLRRPSVTASIWSSGKITCTGATSEEDSKVAARKVSRILQNLGFRVKLSNYRVVNVLGTCSLPFGINIRNFSEEHPRDASYEPELHPGVTFRIKEPKATVKIFSTGSLTITAPSIDNVQSAVGHIFPLVYVFKTPKPPPKKVSAARLLLNKHYGSRKRRRQEGQSQGEDDSDVEDSYLPANDGDVIKDEMDYGSYSEAEEDYASDQSFD